MKFQRNCRLFVKNCHIVLRAYDSLRIFVPLLMTLIKSISGIRGTIGGPEGKGLTPIDVVKFVSAYATFIKNGSSNERIRIVTGRDGRISGEMVSMLANSTLVGMGVDVIDCGYSTTPTVEMAVLDHKADGGIIFTASHNPKQWNALKLLNEKGEFLSGDDGAGVLSIAESGAMSFADVDDLGVISEDLEAIDRHIRHILDLELVDVDVIRNAKLKVAIDCVNSTGGIAIPILLSALGVEHVEELYTEVTGEFPHNPEPLPEHLTELSALVKEKGLDMGITVDPDVDRLAMVCEDGSMFGEEYTLVAVADYVLSHKKGSTVSNLSSSRALRDLTRSHGCEYTASAVGEVNVVKAMKETNAVIGGEGNGGVIVPELHYGRDALAGIALFLSHFAKKGMKATELRNSYPQYVIVKQKLDLPENLDVKALLKAMESNFQKEEITTIDGLKVDFESGWVHLRASNTEPIIRVYAESVNSEEANALAKEVRSKAESIIANLV